MIRRILVGLGDATYAASATQTALELAKSQGAELTGISVLDERRIASVGPVPLGAGSVAVELREHRLAECKRVIDEVIDQFEHTCQQANVPYRVQRPEGEAFRIVAEQIRYHDIMVCGLRRLLEHGVVEEPPDEFVRLIQLGMRPLVAVAPEHRPVRRVLVAYSGSMESALAMKRFVQFHFWPDVEMRIVTFELPEGQARQLLADALEYCQAHDCHVDTDYQPGPAKQSLLPYADQWKADLVVLGNSARNLLLRRIFGETMMNAVEHADRPLFLAQ